VPLGPRMNPTKSAAFEMFDARVPLPEVAAKLNRAASTTRGYLVEYILAKKPDDVDVWVDPAKYARILAASGGTDQMRPIFDALGGEVSYDDISIVLAHVRAKAE